MKPITVKSKTGGNVRLKIYASRSGDRVRYEIRWTDHHGQPHREKRSDLSEARVEAQRIANDLARGHHHAELTMAELGSFRSGIASLEGCGKTIELVTAEYAELQRLLLLTGQASALPTLKELGQFWLAHHRTAAVTNQTVVQAVADFLAWKKTEISSVYHDHLRCFLKAFTAAHPGNMTTLTADGVHVWLRNLPTKTSPRTRNNLLGAVKALFTLPSLQGHPARAGIKALPKFRTAEVLKRLWKPEEFRRLLHAAPAGLLPVLVLGGFCKLRSSEIRRANWEQLRLDDGQLVLMAGQTKTARLRVVPMPPCAVAWLRKVPGIPRGLVWPHGVTTLYKQLRKLCDGVGLAWHRNAMRKSACTYDELSSPGLARNSREAGNSPGILEMNYLSVGEATRKDALEWFALFPPADDRIVPLPVQDTSKSVPYSSPR